MTDRGRRRALLGFVAFGLFWGAWGAILPAVRAGAGVDDGELGIALLMVGLGALVSMRPAGSLVDRYGGVVLPALMAVFGLCAVLPALASSAITLSAALFLLGAASGGLDVAINAAGARAEAMTARPLMNLAHGMFSVAVVVASLATAGLRGLGAGPFVVLVSFLVVAVVVSVVVWRDRGDWVPVRSAERPRRRLEPVLLMFGGVCALAFLVENGWQSWSAVHLDTSLGASAPVASCAPAVFAASAAAGRITANSVLRVAGPGWLLGAGGVLAAAGSGVAAWGGEIWVVLAGIGIAGLGTSVCAPTIIGMAGAWAGEQRRAAAISTVTTLAYLGFLLGPAAVGAASSAWSLRVALGAVAVVALVVGALGPVISRDKTTVTAH